MERSAIRKFLYESWMYARELCTPLLPQNTHWEQWVKYLFIDILYMQYFHNDVVSMYDVRVYVYAYEYASSFIILQHLLHKNHY